MRKFRQVNGIAVYENDDHLQESRLTKKFIDHADSYGFYPKIVPSVVKRSTIERQDVVHWDFTLRINDQQALSGSAEQGLLELFADSETFECNYFAYNQCFRNEREHVGWMRCREFRKVELFSFCHPENWEEKFNHLLTTATTFLDYLQEHYDFPEYRIVDRTTDDPGYHVLKKDIEVLTRTHGWMETHSCTYFGDEQVKRFNITGGVHTISNTGIAFPRILIPLLERG